MKKRILVFAGLAVGGALLLGATLFATVNVAQAAARVGRDLIAGRTGNLIRDITQANANDQGLVVVLVAADSPADKAGVVRGDIILKADSADVNTNADLQKLLATKKISDTVELSITHGDAARKVSAVLTDKNGKAYLGVIALGTDFSSRGGMFGRGTNMPGFGFGMPISNTHILVTEVVTDSPASGAGIRVGDMILSVDGKTFGPNESLSDIVGSHKVGDTIKLSVQHKGDANPSDISIKLGDNPSKSGTPFLGVQYRMGGFGRGGMIPYGGPNGRQGRNPGIQPGDPITPTSPRGGFGALRIPGAMVFSITSGSPAEKAGLQRGDVISAINGKTVDTAQALVDAIAAQKANDEVTLTVRHRMNTTTSEIKVTLGANPDKSGSAYLGVSLGDAMNMPQMNVNPGNRNGGNNGGRPNFRGPGTNPPPATGNTL